MSNSSEEPTRILLLRTGDNEVAAIAAGKTAPAWRPLGEAALAAVAPHLMTRGGTSAKGASVRYFTMRPEDLQPWDSLRKHGDGGYCYGTLWGKRAISKNVQFKEVHAPGQAAPGGPPLDPVAIGTAIAVAQIQADIERLAELIVDLGLDVKAILKFLQLEQEAEVLAATETITELYARFCAELGLGSVDWDRLAGLEQILKTQHRQIVGELESVADAMDFRSVEQAKAAARTSPERVQNLLQLEWHVLSSLAQWSEMMVATKASRGENSLSASSASRRLVESYLRDARAVLQQLHKANSVMHGRGFWKRLTTHGLVIGAMRDDDVDQRACECRDEIRKIATVHKRLPRFAAPPTICLELEGEAFAAPVAALARHRSTPSVVRQ